MFSRSKRCWAFDFIYTNVWVSRCQGQWSMTTLPFKLTLLGEPRQPHPPTRLLMPCCALRPMSPDTALGAFA